MDSLSHYAVAAWFYTMHLRSRHGWYREVNVSRKFKLPFDKRGGMVTLRRQMLESKAFLDLSPPAKTLLLLLQVQWRADRAVGYGVREAEEKIGCSRKIAMRSFSELREAGFIRMVDESLFCSRRHSKTRTWRLTWLPWNCKAPTNDWEKINTIKKAE